MSRAELCPVLHVLCVADVFGGEQDAWSSHGALIKGMGTEHATPGQKRLHLGMISCVSVLHWTWTPHSEMVTSEGGGSLERA